MLMNRLISFAGLSAAAFALLVLNVQADVVNRLDSVSSPRLDLPWVHVAHSYAIGSNSPTTFQNVGGEKSSFRVEPLKRTDLVSGTSFSALASLLSEPGPVSGSNADRTSASVSLKNGSVLALQAAPSDGDGRLTWVPVGGKAGQETGAAGTRGLDLENAQITLTSHSVSSVLSAVPTSNSYATPALSGWGQQPSSYVNAQGGGGSLFIAPAGIKPFAADTPEPSSLVLALLGGFGLLAYRRRLRTRSA
jgi:hypothetical protein